MVGQYVDAGATEVQVNEALWNALVRECHTEDLTGYFGIPIMRIQ